MSQRIWKSKLDKVFYLWLLYSRFSTIFTILKFSIATIYHYAYYKNKTELHGSDITDESHSYVWNNTDTFYIVYKSDGYVEWWQAGTKIKSWSWGYNKTVYLSATFWKQGNGSDNGSFKNIRVRRRQWDGTKYIN